jgi:hypothetical protein
LILVGILLTVIMDMLHGQEVTYALWAVMFSLAGLPIAISSVYKEIVIGETVRVFLVFCCCCCSERVIREQNLDLYYFNGWVSLFQFLFGVLLWPIAMPLQVCPYCYVSFHLGLMFAYRQGLPLSQTLTNVKDALLCWFGGINSLPGDECQSHLWVVAVYFTIAIFNNIFITLVITHGSAALLFIGSALTVPLSNVAFIFPALVGPALSVPFDPFNLVGMVLVLVGMIMFSKAPEPGQAEPPPAAEQPESKAKPPAINEDLDQGAPHSQQL